MEPSIASSSRSRQTGLGGIEGCPPGYGEGDNQFINLILNTLNINSLSTCNHGDCHSRK